RAPARCRSPRIASRANPTPMRTTARRHMSTRQTRCETFRANRVSGSTARSTFSMKNELLEFRVTLTMYVDAQLVGTYSSKLKSICPTISAKAKAGLLTLPLHYQKSDLGSSKISKTEAEKRFGQVISSSRLRIQRQKYASRTHSLPSTL